MKHLFFYLLLIAFNLSCSLDDEVLGSFEQEDIVGSEYVNSDLEVVVDTTTNVTRSNSGEASGSVCKLAPYDNVFDIHWNLSSVCKFISLDVESFAQEHRRWSLAVLGGSGINSYIYTVTESGTYRFYLKYKSPYSSYPKEICLGEGTVTYISTSTPVDQPTEKCNHDYSKISSCYYDVGESKVIFEAISCTEPYKLVFTSPSRLWQYPIVKNIAPPQTYNFTFDFMAGVTDYELRVYSTKCTKDYTKCNDYRAVRFSTFRMGREIGYFD